MVSICCLVYNHERYLRKCIEGFLMQKTNFKYEVLIHDDASTDKSQEIIREYEKKYPGIIKPIYQVENQYSKGKKITLEYQYPRVRGRYVAFCEGDDFWTDETKLQQQVDCLEKHKNSYISGHQVRIIDERGNKLNRVWTQGGQKTGTISSKNSIKLMSRIEGPWFHTSSFLFRAEGMDELINNTPEFMAKSLIGDFTILLFCSSKGDVEYIDKEMGCYRMGSISSITRNHFAGKRIELKKNIIETYLLFNQYTGNRYTEEVNEDITYQESRLLFLEGKYADMLKPKYRKYYSKKRYLFLKILSIFPALTPVMEKLEKIYIKIKKTRKIK